VDGVVLTEPAIDAIAHGSAAGVTTLIGTNRDENKLFMFTDPNRIRYLLGFLPRFVDEPMYEATAEYLSRMWKVNGADQPAEAMQQSEPAVFVYRFDWDEEPSLLGSDLSKMLGAAHAFEIPFVFGHWDLGRAGSRIFTAENEPGRQALSRAMMSYWVQFARTGNPGKGVGEDLPQWAAWTPSQPAYLVFDTPDGGGVRMLDGKETAERVLADLYADPRLQPIKARCRVMHDLAERGRGYTREEFEAQCKTLPNYHYPWPD
jgi:para-nitrobenzyl esterase